LGLRGFIQRAATLFLLFPPGPEKNLGPIFPSCVSGNQELLSVTHLIQD
jgi:hypothetical protein